MARRISRKKSANFISDPSSVNVRLPLANKTFHIRHFRYGSPTTVSMISEWISGFRWISGFQIGFLPTVYEISFVADPSVEQHNEAQVSAMPTTIHSTSDHDLVSM